MKTTVATRRPLRPISLEGEINPYLHLTNRTAGSPSSTVMQNVKDQLKANGADGKYYISARIKLDTAGDTAYVSPMIRAGALQLRPFGGEKRFAVTNEWTEVGKNADGSFVAMSVANGTFDEATLAGLSWGKFYFELYAAESGGTAYDGDFSIDDVVLWFVPNAGAPEKVTEVGESILSDGTFDAHLNDRIITIRRKREAIPGTLPPAMRLASGYTESYRLRVAERRQRGGRGIRAFRYRRTAYHQSYRKGNTALR